MTAKFYLYALPLLPFAALASDLPSAPAQHGSPQGKQQTEQQLGVHQHGLASLSLALNEQQLVLELLAPAADIIGFEHAPQNIEQEQQQAASYTRVQDGNALFTLPKQAQCTFIDSKLLVEEEDELHQEPHEHAKADSQKTAAAKHNDEHDDHDEHEHEHDEHGHSDVLVQYQYQCLQPQALNRLETQLFAQFPSLNNIELQGIVSSGQVAASLSPEQTQASW